MRVVLKSGGFSAGYRLRSVYTERLRHPLTLMMDVNAFYIEINRKTQTLSLGENGVTFTAGLR